MTSGDEFYPDTFVYTLLKSCVKKKLLMIVKYLTCILIEQPLLWEHFLYNFILISSKVYIFR